MVYQSSFTPIVKPVDGLCNLSCSYCYTLALNKDGITNHMKLETLGAVIDFFCSNQDDVEFIWHGGEPLLAGLDFYTTVAKFQRKWEQQGKKITNFIQTNATLITSQWVQFFTENNFFIGVSLDGPKELHNQVRCYSNGKGSFDEVMKGIDLLREAGVFNGVICSVSSINYRNPKELFDFFIAQNIKKLKFGRVKNIGHCSNISSLVVSPAQYTDFMIAIFNLWLELDDPKVEIRDIQSVVNLILGGNKRECIYMGQCDQYVTIYSDGSIYACDSFPKTDDLHFGSVFDKPGSIQFKPQLQTFREQIKRRKEFCCACNWYFICKGGCTKDYYGLPYGIKPASEICDNLQRYFNYISTKIRSYGLI